MTKLTGALVACLGLGTADVAVLNVWLLPGLLGPPAEERSAGVVPSAKPVAQGAPAPVPVLAPAPVPVAVAAPAPVAAPAAVAAPAPVPLADSAALTPSRSIGVIAFEKGSWRVGQRATAAIEKMADQVRGQLASVEVSGHADASGSDEVNDRISELRAEAVARRLERAGIARERIAVSFFGARRPAGLPNERRVEISARAGPAVKP